MTAIVRLGKMTCYLSLRIVSILLIACRL